MWMHIDFWWANYDKNIEKELERTAIPRPSGKYLELLTYLADIVLILEPKRFFFLFEEYPNLFLAFEKDAEDFKIQALAEYDNKILNVNKPDWIMRPSMIHEGHDETNGEHALKVYCAAAYFAFYRPTSAYKPGYYNNDSDKLVHCFCNTVMCSWKNEIDFYCKGLIQRGVRVPRILRLLGKVAWIRFVKFCKGIKTKNRRAA